MPHVIFLRPWITHLEYEANFSSDSSVSSRGDKLLVRLITRFYFFVVLSQATGHAVKTWATHNSAHDCEFRTTNPTPSRRACFNNSRECNHRIKASFLWQMFSKMTLQGHSDHHAWCTRSSDYACANVDIWVVQAASGTAATWNCVDTRCQVPKISFTADRSV